jgi:pimeloyl-ACP methyl ester carboxylesterase
VRRSLGRTVAPDGLAIATETSSWGPEPAPGVVAVHATGFCKEVFRPVVAALSSLVEAGAVTAVDQRGHGSSGRPDPPFDWWDLGGDVLAVTDDLDAGRPPVAVGHSAGGAAVAMAELMSPGTFSALVLVEPIIFPPPHVRQEEGHMVDAALKRKRSFDSPAAAAENFAGKPTFAGWHPAALTEYVEHGLLPSAEGRVLACDPEVEAEFYRMGSAHDTWDRLDRLTLPVTLVAGEQSTTHHGGYLEDLASRFGSPPAVDIVPGASHFVVMERPELVAAHVAARIPAGVEASSVAHPDRR